MPSRVDNGPGEAGAPPRQRGVQILHPGHTGNVITGSSPYGSHPPTRTDPLNPTRTDARPPGGPVICYGRYLRAGYFFLFRGLQRAALVISALSEGPTEGRQRANRGPSEGRHLKPNNGMGPLRPSDGPLIYSVRPSNLGPLARLGPLRPSPFTQISISSNYNNK